MENPWLDSVIEAHRKYYGGKAENILDVGTRDGDDAEFFREHLNAEHVYAIDANPVAVEATRKAYPDMTVYETGISDHNGSATFLQINSEDKGFAGTSSLDVTKAVRERVFDGMTNHITVPLIRLDSLFEDEGLSETIWDVVKIDVESYTYEALVGMGEAVRNVKIFHLETEPKYDRRGHRNHIQVASFMRSFGFHLYDLSYEWGPGIQDQVWLNKNLALTSITEKELSEREIPSILE